MDYLTALKRPFTNWKNLGIGCLVSIIPFVNILSFGYIYRVIELSLKNDYSMPAWKGWKQLLVNGILFLLINIVYAVPLFLFSLFMSFLLYTRTNIYSQIAVFSNNIILQLLYLFVMAYFVPVVLINFVRKGKFKAAFEFSEFKKVFRGKYVLAWITASLLTIALTVTLRYIGGFLAIDYLFELAAGFISMVISFTLLVMALK